MATIRLSHRFLINLLKINNKKNNSTIIKLIIFWEKLVWMGKNLVVINLKLSEIIIIS